MRISDWSSDVCSSDLEGVGEAVAVEVDQRLAHLAVDLEIDEEHLIDAVEVPFVVRGHLVEPLGHAGVEVTCEDGHGPAVVAGALHRVPGAGVAGAVVDQVQFRIVGEPAPGAAADRKSVVSGKRVSVRVYRGGRRSLTKTKQHRKTTQHK